MRVSLRTAGIILAAVMVGSTLLASCSSSTSSPSSSATTTSSKPTGSLTIAVNFYDGNLVGAAGKVLRRGNTFQALGAGIFDSLIELTADGQPRPGIAERWEMAPDGMSHTFYLRKGVKFHDGSDLTGVDVKYGIENLLAPEVIDTDANVFKAQIASVELKDDYTLVIRFKKPQYELLRGLESLSGYMAVIPKKYIEEKGFDYFARNPIGSGPYKVVKWEMGNRLELEAVENHWRVVPKFKNITLVSVKEEGTKIAMLKTGELDLAEVAPDSAAGLKTAGLRTLGHYGGSQWYFAPSYPVEEASKYAFGDVRVRKAMSLAVDRKEVADKLTVGFGQPSALYGVPTMAYFFDPSQIRVDPFDPDGAKKLLAEAGYPTGFSTKIWDTGGGSAISNFFLALSGYWRKVGINAEVTPAEYAVVLSKWTGKLPRPPEMNNSVWGTSTGGGYFGFEKMFTAYHSTGTFRNLKISRLDELIDKVPQTADAATKKKMAQEAALLAKNEYSAVAVVDVDTIFAFGSKVGELKPVKGMMGLSPAFETITHPK